MKWYAAYYSDILLFFCPFEEYYIIECMNDCTIHHHPISCPYLICLKRFLTWMICIISNLIYVFDDPKINRNIRFIAYRTGSSLQLWVWFLILILFNKTRTVFMICKRFERDFDQFCLYIPSLTSSSLLRTVLLWISIVLNLKLSLDFSVLF